MSDPRSVPSRVDQERQQLNWSGRMLHSGRPEPMQCDCGAPAQYGREVTAQTSSAPGTMRWFCLSCWVQMGYWKENKA